MIAPEQGNDQNRTISGAQKDIACRCQRDCQNILGLRGLERTDRLLYDRLVKAEVLVLKVVDQLFAHPVIRAKSKFILFVELVDCSGVSTGKLYSKYDNRGQHGRKVERRVDCLAYIAECAKFVHRARKIARSLTQ